MGRSAPCVGPQNNHTPSPRCAALAPWAVGRFYKGLIMRGSRGSAFERGGHNRSKTESPTCRGVGAIEPWPTTWRGACSELGHNTTTPSPNCVARVLRGRSANTARGESARAGRHDFQTRWLNCFEARAADLSRCWCGRASADGVGRSAPRAGPQHAKCVLCAARAHWAVGLYSTARNAHGPHVTGFERVDHDWLDPVPPTSRSVGVVETRLMACGGGAPRAGPPGLPTLHLHWWWCSSLHDCERGGVVVGLGGGGRPAGGRFLFTSPRPVHWPRAKGGEV